MVATLLLLLVYVNAPVGLFDTGGVNVNGRSPKNFDGTVNVVEKTVGVRLIVIDAVFNVIPYSLNAPCVAVNVRGPTPPPPPAAAVVVLIVAMRRFVGTLTVTYAIVPGKFSPLFKRWFRH
jgi:hypothetical protein